MESNNKLDTYNRVRNLPSPLIRLLFNAVYLLLICLLVASGFWYWLSSESKTYSIAALASTAATCIIVGIIDHRRKNCCQYCGNTLFEIVRPLILTTKFLSLQGTRCGDYFFTQHSSIKTLFNKQWVKISNRSLACHHCRLTEERYYQCFEQVSQTEIDALQHDKQC